MELSKHIIEAELNHILASPQIANSTVLSEFIKFIVQETLEGRSHELKEYTIGINVLKRDVDFNPQIDSIVRIHAGRLRRALKEYYYEDGRENTLIISIPKGGYVPSFQINSKASKKTTPENFGLTDIEAKKTIDYKEEKLTFVTYQKEEEDVVKPKISLAVLPFKHIGKGEDGECFTRSMSEYISTELTLFDYIHVISNYSGNSVISKTKDIREVCALLGTEYVLTGSVQFYENMVRVWIQLNNNNGEQLWGHTFEKKDTDQSLWEYQDTIITYLIAYVMGIHGVILRDQFRKITDTNDLSNPVLSIYWYSQYDANFDESFIKKAKTFYNELIEKEPDNALAHAYLSMILMGEVFFLPKNIEENMKLGFIHGQLSLKLDPLCQQVYVAMAANFLALHEKHRCIDILEQGLKINPRSFDYQNTMGAILFGMGEFERGAELFNGNFQINPNVLWWQKINYTYYLYHQKKYEETISLAEQINYEGVWIPILKAASYAQMDRTEEAQNIVDQLKKKYSHVDLSGQKGLKRYFCSDDFINELMEGLKKLKL